MANGFEALFLFINVNVNDMEHALDPTDTIIIVGGMVATLGSSPVGRPGHAHPNAPSKRRQLRGLVVAALGLHHHSHHHDYHCPALFLELRLIQQGI
jgi:hypothetical protein